MDKESQKNIIYYKINDEMHYLIVPAYIIELLEKIAQQENLELTDLCSEIRSKCNSIISMQSAIAVFLSTYLREELHEEEAAGQLH